MKILITSFTYHPQINGVAEVVRAHARGFIARGHEVTIATATDPTRKPAQAKGEPSVREFSVHGDGNWRNGIHGDKEGFLDFVRHWQGDVILSHCWQSWPTDLVARTLPHPVARAILVSHGFNAHLYPMNSVFPRGTLQWLGWRPYVWSATRMLRKFDHVVFLSTLANRGVYFDHWLARRHGLTHCSSIPTGVNMEEFDAALPDFRKVYGLGSAPMVLCVASYSEMKGQREALQAFLEANVPGAVMVFIGNQINDYARELQQMSVLALGEESGRVRLLEGLDRNMIHAAYQAADVFLCPSRWESGPLVVLEAMAAKTPFVSFDLGFVSTLPGGIVVRSVSEMAVELRRLLGNAKERERLGAMGRQACEQFYNWPVILSQYDALLSQVVAGKA